MRIIVAIKQVPDTDNVKMDPVTGTMIRDGVEAIINPLDLYGIELALRLREKHGGEVHAVTMGPPKAISALREAIAMGVDGGTLLSAPAFAGADTWATSRVLAAAIKKLGPCDLLLCGERATDGDTGQVGPNIAAWLDWPVASYVSRFDHFDGKVCRVQRLLEDGYETLEMDLPGVLTVVKEVAEPRLPTLKGKLRAHDAQIATWGPNDLDVKPEELGLKGSPTRVVKIESVKFGRTTEMHTALDELAVAKAADRLVAFLDEREVLQ